MNSNRIFLLFALVLLGGCGGGNDADSELKLSDASFPGVYSGVFPCEGCPGIPTTLWLRSDGRFFIEQRYLAADGQEALNTHSLGRWNRAVDERTVVLEGLGPTRSFVRHDVDTLIMQTNSELEHRLIRDLAAPAFSATIRLVGMARMRGGNAWFTECLTGLKVPVSKSGDFKRFRHQFRSASGRGDAVVAESKAAFPGRRAVRPNR